MEFRLVLAIPTIEIELKIISNTEESVFCYIRQKHYSMSSISIILLYIFYTYRFQIYSEQQLLTYIVILVILVITAIFLPNKILIERASWKRRLTFLTFWHFMFSKQIRKSTNFCWLRKATKQSFFVSFRSQKAKIWTFHFP